MAMQAIRFYDYTDRAGEHVRLTFSKGSYSFGDGLYVAAYCIEGGFIEPYADVTVNLADTVPGRRAFLDGDLDRSFVEWLEGIGAGKRTGRVARSGFCKFAEFAFDRGWLASVAGEYEPIERGNLS